MINLVKGQRIELAKAGTVGTDGGINRVIFGLGWDVNTTGGADFDLDASAFLIGADGTCKEQDVVYYNNLEHWSGAVKSSGDNRTGVGDGDDESILVTLAAVPDYIEKISFVVSVYDALVRNQNFGQVRNAYIHAVDDNGNELMRYDLQEDFSIETSVIAGTLYRHNGAWKFAAEGVGLQGDGINAAVDHFNVG